MNDLDPSKRAGRPAMAPRPTKTKQNFKLDPGLLERLRDSAQQRGMTLTGVIEDAGRTYLDGQAVLVAIADIEARLSASLVATQNEVAQVYNAVQINMAMLDQLSKFLFFNTDEVPPADEEAALIRADMRHAAFIEAMPGSYDKRKRRAKIVTAIEERESSEED